MFYQVSRRRLLLLISLVTLMNPIAAQSQQKISLRDLYDKQFGTLGLSLRHVRDVPIQASSSDSDMVQVLDPGKLNLLPKQKTYCFIINHRLDDTPPGKIKPTFFGVKLVFNDTINVPPVYLFRNNGWASRSSSLQNSPSRMTKSRAGLEEFNNLHSLAIHPKPSYSLMDSRLGAQWHGKPSDSQRSSLDYVTFFKSETRFDTPLPGRSYPRPYSSETFLRETAIKRNPIKALIGANRPKFAQTLTGYLISYTPAPERATSSTLVKSNQKAVFCFNRHEAVSAYLKVFSPLGETDHSSWYGLVLDNDSSLVE